MSGRCCARCEHAFSEPWPGDKYALRCGNPADDEHRGRVVNFYPSEGMASIMAYPAPAWCQLNDQNRRSRA